MKFFVASLLVTTASAALSPIWEFVEKEHDIKLVNDPVMGGKSNSTYVNTDGVLNWDGGVEIVPSLSAPGFCNLESAKMFLDKFPSAETAKTMTLLVKSDTPDYKGFKFSFAGDTFNPQFKSYKADFFLDESTPVDEASGFYRVDIPLNQFSNNWSSYTGEPIVKCEDDESVCPSAKALKKIQQVGFWAEGVEGHFNLDIKGVYFDDAETTTTAKEAICTVQDNLKFGIDETAASVGLPNAPPDESLAQAVCCDSAFAAFPEPNTFFESKRLFARVDSKGVNTFYDSSCGIPVFQAPVGRTFAEWKEDTTEHGWPAFRGEEIIAANVELRDDNNYYSKCGTKLGTTETDATGTRACIDLVCIAGNEQQQM